MGKGVGGGNGARKSTVTCGEVVFGDGEIPYLRP